MSNFFEGFFSKTTVSNCKLVVVANAQYGKTSQKLGDKIWEYISLLDLLNLSVCSQAAASLTASKAIIDSLSSTHPRVSRIGEFNLSFSTDLKIGLLRRILCRVATGKEGILSIDGNSGRVVMDIGSAFNDQDAFLAVTAVPFPEELDSLAEPRNIDKYLEGCSVDEYDDFAPRFPLPRDKTHRRGDSMFNSDIESIASEALSQDLQSIALSALALEQMDLKGPSGPPKHHRAKKGISSSAPVQSDIQEALARDALNAADSDEEKEGKR